MIKVNRVNTDDYKLCASGEFLSKQTTLVRVTKQTRDQLAQHGEYGDSMDSIINKLLKEVN